MPDKNEFFYAERGKGAEYIDKNNNKQFLKRPDLVDSSSVIYAGHFGFNYKQEDNGRRSNLYKSIRFGHRSFGSAAVSLAYTALGRVDATYFECPLEEWDCQAGILLCKESGLVADFYPPAKTGEHRRLIAAPENLSEEILRISDSC